MNSLRTRLFLPVAKQDPADAVLASHRLLVRAGFVRQASAGAFSFLPLGLRVLEKLTALIDRHMAAAGACKVEMPALMDAELWRASGRWESTGAELFRLQDRRGHDFCLGPTHEELVTALVGHERLSYKQLPVNLYQITRKFRDEMRPRFGLLRAREFLMKDAYSFAESAADAEETYAAMRAAYDAILRELAVPFAEVEADTGNIGGSLSHELHVLSDAGEDVLVVCGGCGYSANQEKAATRARDTAPHEEHEVVVGTEAGEPLAVVRLPAGEAPNELKVARALGVGHVVSLPRHPASAAAAAGVPELHHSEGFTLAREGHTCPTPGCGGALRETAGIEVGHVFHLGTLYADKLAASFQGRDGRPHPLVMGCYGMGVSRLMAASVEALHDDRGIVWPEAIAPFRAAVVTPGARAGEAADQAEEAGRAVAAALGGEDVLLDDRWTARTGFKLSEAELLGHPWIVVAGRDYAAQGLVEVRNRRTGEEVVVSVEAAAGLVNGQE